MDGFAVTITIHHISFQIVFIELTDGYSVEDGKTKTDKITLMVCGGDKDGDTPKLTFCTHCTALRVFFHIVAECITYIHRIELRFMFHQPHV